MGLSTGSKGHGSGGFHEINVTPLVDVMLVLLVVFMVAAPLLVTGLKVDLPNVKAANTPVKDAKLVISVTKEDRIFLGEKDVTEQVEQALMDSFRVQDQRVLYIQADRLAHYSAVARAVAAAKAADVTSLNLLVDPEETKP